MSSVLFFSDSQCTLYTATLTTVVDLSLLSYRKKAKPFPKRKAHGTALISNSVALSQTPAEAARPWTRSQCVIRCACLPASWRWHQTVLLDSREASVCKPARQRRQWEQNLLITWPIWPFDLLGLVDLWPTWEAGGCREASMFLFPLCTPPWWRQWWRHCTPRGRSCCWRRWPEAEWVIRLCSWFSYAATRWRWASFWSQAAQAAGV